MIKLLGIILTLAMLLSGVVTAAAESAASEVQLLCLNIGKGDCLLLFYGETRWLIDAGYEVSWPALKAALAEYGVDHLDGVFLTHCHEDHYGGLTSLAGSDIPVGAWYASPLYYDINKEGHPLVLAARQRGEEVTWLSAGTEIPVGGDASFTVLGPLSVNEKNENNNSLVLSFSSPAGSILLCGDMKNKEEKELVEAGNISACTLLKAGHHGDSKTLTSEFLMAARPQAAVICTSTAQEPDTPAPAVLDKLKNIDCQAYVTQDFHDAVLFTLSGGKVTGVEDISWTGVPARAEGITMEIDYGTDTITLRNTAAEPVSLDGYTIFSTTGNEALTLKDLTLENGGSWTIGGRKTTAPVDQIWDEKYVWSDKKRDVGALYDPWGRPVACADNGLKED